MENINTSNHQQNNILTLWIVTASSSEKQQPLGASPDLTTATYARNQTDAEKNVQLWLARHPERPYHHFMECPTGFCVGVQTWLPGFIQETK